MDLIIGFFNSKYIVTISGILTMIIAILTLRDKILTFPTLKVDYLKAYVYEERLLLLNFKVINPTLRNIDFYKIILKINDEIFNPYILPATYWSSTRRLGAAFDLYHKYKIHSKHGELSAIETATIQPGSSISLNLLYDIENLNEIKLNKVELFLESSLRKKRVKLDSKCFQNIQ